MKRKRRVGAERETRNALRRAFPFIPYEPSIQVLWHLDKLSENERCRTSIWRADKKALNTGGKKTKHIRNIEYLHLFDFSRPFLYSRVIIIIIITTLPHQHQEKQPTAPSQPDHPSH